MIYVQAVAPLLFIWLCIFSVLVPFCMAFEIYRSRKKPDFDSIKSLAGAWICFYIGSRDPNSPLISAFGFLISGLTGYGSCAFAFAALKANRSLEEIKSSPETRE